MGVLPRLRSKSSHANSSFRSRSCALGFKSSAGSDTTVHRVPLKLEGDSVIVRIPIAKLGGDDGNMTITTIIGTVDRPTDIAPNSGVILARPAAGAVVANAVSGVDAAPGQKARPRRSVSWPPR